MKMITVPGDDLLGWTRVATFHPLLLALESWVPLQCGFQHRTGLLDITLLRGMGILPLPFPAATGTHQPGQLEQVTFDIFPMGLSVKKLIDKMFSFAAAYFARPSLTLSAVPATGFMLFGTRYDHSILNVHPWSTWSRLETLKNNWIKSIGNFVMGSFVRVLPCSSYFLYRC